MGSTHNLGLNIKFELNRIDNNCKNNLKSRPILESRLNSPYFFTGKPNQAGPTATVARLV